MDARTLNQTIDLPALLGWPSRGRKWLAGPCPFCGGRDRFVLKRTPDGWCWYCRGCGDGRYHTAIDFIMRREGLTFKEALERLGADPGRPLKRVLHPPPAQVTRPPDAQVSGAWHLVRQAHERLTPDSPGGQYLLGRGLRPPTWGAWLLGEWEADDPQLKRRRPAILIPNVEDWRGGRILGVKYRFIDRVDGGLRYVSARGSQVVPFGLCYCTPDWPDPLTLLVVEGELNALSVWQCAPERLDVVSTGSQTPSQVGLGVLVGLARRYAQVVVWLDDGDKAKDLARKLGAGGALQSPLVGGAKLDANALLQQDGLHDFLREALGVKCYGPGRPHLVQIASIWG